MNKKKIKCIGIGSIFLAVILSIAIIVWEIRRKICLVDILGNIALSILCSLLASLIFFLFQSGFDKADNEAVKMQLDSIDSNLKTQKSLYDSGIVSIRKKSYFDRDASFWNGIIVSTSDRLDLIGHSISHWLGDKYKDIFIQKITEMISSGKKVRFILSGSDFSREKIKAVIAGRVKEKSLGKLNSTCYSLWRAVQKVDEDKRKNLEVYITELTYVTYLYIRTDRQCFVSPYILSPSDSQNSFLLELQADVEYSRSFDNDFNEMIEKLDSIEWSIDFAG